jgi:hypothetical protein
MIVTKPLTEAAEIRHAVVLLVKDEENVGSAKEVRRRRGRDKHELQLYRALAEMFAFISNIQLSNLKLHYKHRNNLENRTKVS